MKEQVLTHLPQLEADALTRFLRYVRVDTQSDPDSSSYPSTAKQLDLLRMLRDELADLGYADAAIDRSGYVTATLPSNLPPDALQPPVIAFFAHVDTSPDVSGANVRPLVWRSYSGEPLTLLTLPGDTATVLTVDTTPDLAHHIGHDIVTSDGTTLLGADDKAGVAVIMAAAAFLISHTDIRHGTLKWVFNPDEEVGHGVDHLDLQQLGATYAYTLDAGIAGEVQDETFSADQVRIRFTGVSSHPGTAKDKMVSAIKVAAGFVAALPRDQLSPETTEGREGFVHPTDIRGSIEETVVTLIVRDFDTAGLATKEDLLRELAGETVSHHSGARWELSVVKQYRNMRDTLEHHPLVTALADQAVRRVGLEPIHTPIRGGTDGSRLTERGLPTPNLFAGWRQAHSRSEWVCARDMGLSACTIIELARLWADLESFRTSGRAP
ncbi:MAG: peptidase T [Chloroflexi bacterium]|nr:peptidase T [Chloroflexota bacterium]